MSNQTKSDVSGVHKIMRTRSATDEEKVMIERAYEIAQESTQEVKVGSYVTGEGVFVSGVNRLPAGMDYDRSRVLYSNESVLLRTSFREDQGPLTLVSMFFPGTSEARLISGTNIKKVIYGNPIMERDVYEFGAEKTAHILAAAGVEVVEEDMRELESKYNVGYCKEGRTKLAELRQKLAQESQ